MTEQPLPKRLMALIYSASMLTMASYTLWLYALGNYRELLVPMLATLLLLVALLMHYGLGVASCLPRSVLLISTYAVVSSALYNPPTTPLIWLGLPIAATFLLFPLWGTFYLLALCPPILWMLYNMKEASLSFTLGYLALILLLALPPWEHARRRALLRATDPHDSDCSAYNIDTLKERLHNEFQRAAMLNKRLAVLAIHLPQLDMAEEQFGPRAKTALLCTLCSEVNSRCRDHDLLGRAETATFWLVLPDTSESGALLVRERLQRALSRCVLIETGQLETRINVCLPSDQESFKRYVQRLEALAKALSNA